MNQMTLRQIPKPVENEIRRLAAKTGDSINKTVIKLLKKSLGISDNLGKKRDLSQLAGTWTDEDEREFRQSTAIFDQIDEDIWKNP